jgi:hypothetical protein
MRYLLCAFVLLTFPMPDAGAQGRTRNVVLIVTDGLRWQEVFRGAERGLMSRRPGGVSDTSALIRDFWRDDVQARREALLPFVWGTIARQGVLFGNQDRGSVGTIVNRYRFSYPGYNEILSGWFDPRIDSNDYPPNPNVTVFEWLAQRQAYRGRVAAIATWDAFRRIFNEGRSGVEVLDGWDPPFVGAAAQDPTRAAINEFYKRTVRLWPTNTFDSHMHLAAKEYIKLRQPRVLFLGYGETDEWSHAGRYDLLLQSARSVDASIAELWAMMQGMPQYRDSTTFIITVDHGRGSGDEEWKSHGERVEGAQHIWVAILGPDTPALGEVQGRPVSQSQIAATVAALLGEDYRAAEPRAGRVIEGAIRR